MQIKKDKSFQKYILPLFFGLSFGSLYGQFDVSEWIRVDAIDKSCTIYAPSKMGLKIDSLEVEIGKIYYIHHIIRTDPLIDPNFLYQLSYTNYPPGVIPQDSIDIIRDMLEMTVNQSVMAQNGELLYSADKDYKDYPGKIWRTAYDNDQYGMKSLAYFAHDHLFMIHVAFLKENSTNKAVDHFLNSFKIIEP